MSILALVISMCLGAVNYQFGDVSDSIGLIYSKKEVLANFLLAFFLSWLPLIAAVLYGILISAIIRKAGQAVGLVIGSIIVLEAVKHFINIGPFVFTTYLGSSWIIFHQVAQGVDYQLFPEIWKMITVSLIYCFVTFTAGSIIFSKRDLNG